MEDDTAIIDLGSMLAILLAQPDAETAINGMRHVAITIVDHARAIRHRRFPDEVTS